MTISAAYGAGGSSIGPAIAERLDIPFIDRAIPVSVATKLGISVEEADALTQDSPGRIWSMFAGLSLLPGYPPSTGIVGRMANERQLLEQTEAQINRVADEGSCVILGHAAAIVLAGRVDALHVRLDGSIEGRIRAAMAQHGINKHEAVRAQKENDKIRSGYVQHFYRCDSARFDLYHMVLDSVRLTWHDAENLIVAAAQAVDLTH